MADTLQSKLQTPRNLREKLIAWDVKTDPKAPLTDSQKDSFMELTTLSANKPLPIELPLDDFPVISAHKATQQSQNEEDPLAREFSRLAYDKVENSQQFFSWFSEVEEKMAEEEDQQQKEFVNKLQGHKSACDEVIEEVTQALTFLEELKVKYVTVSRKTNALHEDCENLLEEQAQLVNKAESINNKLAYFNELERISSKIGSPTLTVTSESFVPMLSRLDECIAYLAKNPQYRESQVYTSRFKQCLSRACNLIKTHVTHILQTATQQVTPKKPSEVFNLSLEQDITSPTDDAFTLFYGKFRTNAPRVKMLMEQVENRLSQSNEYSQLLSDCHQCYFQQRKALLGPSVCSAVTELAAKNSRDHCALVRSGCAFMVHVCEDEYQLFSHFFTQHTPELDGMLEGLCNNLYDVLRPLIIHVNHLETLAELCSILKVEMIEEHVNNSPEHLSAFEVVCSQMLEDVQERLVYRTHIYIRQEILNYNPALGDLAYPDKLIMMESIAASLKSSSAVDMITSTPSKLSRIDSTSSVSSQASLEVEQINARAKEPLPFSTETTENGINGVVATNAVEQNGSSGDHVIQNGRQPGKGSFVTVNLSVMNESGPGGNMPMSPADLHGMWYPTVRRTLVCLSKLYRCIDRATFQGLSQETLMMCITSLTRATDLIKKHKSAIDSQLFLIKHLLILREQIAPFNVEFAVKEMGLDFTKIKDAAFGLLNARSKVFSLNRTNALLQFLLEGTPQMTETFIDSKKDVDSQLKKACEDFISNVTDQLIGPLRLFMSKAGTLLKMREDPSAPQVTLRQQPFATPEKVQEVVAETYRNLKNKKGDVQRSMALYLANKDTEFILFKPIKSSVQQSFQQLQQLMDENYTEEDQQIIGSPSIEQVNLLLTSTTKH